MRQPGAVSPEALAQALRDVSGGRYDSNAVEVAAWKNEVLDALYEVSRTDPAAMARYDHCANANRMFGGIWAEPVSAVEPVLCAIVEPVPETAAIVVPVPETITAAVPLDGLGVCDDLPDLGEELSQPCFVISKMCSY
ncbi:unnamed protein product [Polarella glacialis]|uniref:Uncharacterized protein n=1 Tax=Polarella glacialis TaxID=89957 RepID=A0A813G1J2_POLGL|nr:unnamed protein product [Polarella glacialis]